MPLLTFTVGLGWGSSIRTNASVSSGPGPVKLLVTFVFRNSETFMKTGAPGLPPVQLSMISLTSSAFPSKRKMGGTAALATQEMGDGI